MSEDLALPPRVSLEAASDFVPVLEQLLERLRTVAGNEVEGSWGLEAADVGVDLVSIGTVLADSGVAVAALEGESLRAIAERLGISNTSLPRRMAGTPELADYAEDTSRGRSVTQGAIERARYDLRHDQFTVEGEPQRVPRRRR